MAERARIDPGAFRRHFTPIDAEKDKMGIAIDNPFDTAVALIAGLSEPEVTVPVHCRLGERTAVRVRAGRETVQVDELDLFGGTGLAPNPIQYALAALGACEAITFRYWSDRLAIRIDELRVDVWGEVDLRGFLGLAEGARAGFSRVRMRIKLSGPEPAERYEELRLRVEEHCAILDVFANSVPVETVLDVA